MKVFGENMRKAREEKGLTQEQLAEILKTKQNTISRWENGEREPSLEMVVKIARSLDCDPNYLLGFDE